jgi:hypothetical protein
MPTLPFISPERHWRAASLVLLAAFLAWRAVRYAGPDRATVLAVIGLVAGLLLGFVIPVMRTCLLVTEAGLIDRRAIRTVRVAWPQIAELRVARPGGLWGGFCIVADCRDGTHVDLLSVRAYSLRPPTTSMTCTGCAGPWRSVSARAARTPRPVPSRAYDGEPSRKVTGTGPGGRADRRVG